jgi:deazaflavin-dependent oxidoreductase (nitroreductase family)
MNHALQAPQRRLAVWLGHQRWFAAFARRFGARVDRAVYEVTKGKLVSMGPPPVPILLLTTTGRRTGRRRTTPVIYLREGDGFVISSEDFGQKRPAAWPLNLDSDPLADVQIGDEVLSCRARRLTEPEAEGFWPRLVEVWPPHATYRRRSGQRHSFLLEPLD